METIRGGKSIGHIVSRWRRRHTAYLIDVAFEGTSCQLTTRKEQSPVPTTLTLFANDDDPTREVGAPGGNRPPINWLIKEFEQQRQTTRVSHEFVHVVCTPGTDVPYYGDERIGYRLPRCDQLFLGGKVDLILPNAQTTDESFVRYSLGSLAALAILDQGQRYPVWPLPQAATSTRQALAISHP